MFLLIPLVWNLVLIWHKGRRREKRRINVRPSLSCSLDFLSLVDNVIVVNNLLKSKACNNKILDETFMVMKTKPKTGRILSQPSKYH